MPKVIDQSIPPSLEILYHQLVSPAKVTQGSDGIVRLKKGKKEPKKPTRENLDLAAFKALADQVSKELFLATGKLLTDSQKFELVQDMIVGIYPMDYFKPCPLTNKKGLQSFPLCLPDPAPPPYGYRPPNFLPTTCAYPDGGDYSGTMGTFGEKDGIYWMDRNLRWNRLTFSADSYATEEREKRMAFFWAVTIGIHTSSRASRPMVSLNILAQSATDGAGVAVSTAPPIMAKTSFYWRFKVPFASPPYYDSEQFRRISIPVPRILKKPFVIAPDRLVINACNRPMMGRGFNNNDWVETDTDSEPIVYEIRSCLAQNLKTWTPAATNPAASHQAVAVNDLGNVWIALAPSGTLGAVLRSTDAHTWTTHNTGTGRAWADVLYCSGFGLWLIVSSDGTTNQAASSPNGSSWTLRAMPAIRQWRCLAYSPTLERAVAGSSDTGTNNAAYTNNGKTWLLATTPSGWRFRGVCWSELLQLFVAVGNDSTSRCTYTSSDGINWTKHPQAGTVSWVSVAWSPALRLFMATSGAASDTSIATSPDGINWTSHTQDSINWPSKIIWAPDAGAFIIACQLLENEFGNSGIAYTRDAIEFKTARIGTNTQCFALAWSEQQCKLVVLNTTSAEPKIWHSP